MRRCGHCKAIPRRDDELDVVQYQTEVSAGTGTVTTIAGPTVTVCACRQCRAVLSGVPDPGDPTYPHGREYPWIVCGVCRHALRDNDLGDNLRLHPSDVAGTEVQPGHYWSCNECIAQFKPIIYQRLLAHPEHYDPNKNGVLLPDYESFGGNWLT